MKTKEKIKVRATELFNKKGIKNVTLREVAKDLGISYGNVTYHFKNKNDLILALYEEMQAETAEIIKTFDFNNLFLGILQAPKMTFDISIKYLFFYIDYVEIRRGYAELFVKVEADNERRKAGYLHILKQLQVQGILRKELSDADLDYLMELSGAMRTFFFMKLNPENFTDPDLKDRYVDYVNRLVFPYLTATGIEQYEAK
jgi:AcrR family transcriptional regulator